MRHRRHLPIYHAQLRLMVLMLSAGYEEAAGRQSHVKDNHIKLSLHNLSGAFPPKIWRWRL